ncbi:phosphatase PAP2 family protein [Microbacterium sp. W4I20]|uniref:phosphatase PAP2 family protein n=1 Tax=Microbacterium sp. W4I20 TaxID=3042262 RepID=UPI00278B6D3A|nr:phosphatase PAP2 family protein [Microbacterium sp. W4I20]MDQ0728569.1 membrane-associated phospholipid phosphatase [Microbacterium sp. W4I20]
MNRRKLLWWGVGCLALATALGAAIVFGFEEPPALDQWWNETVASVRGDWMYGFALALNWIGGGWVAILGVPLLAILALLLARRWRGALFAAICFALSAGAVQLLKQLFGRARPEDMLVLSDYGSFPSGHTANAATIALVVWVLFPKAWTAIVGAVWILAMALSRTFLSVHWASDTLGGALVGAGVVLVLAAWLLPWAQRRKGETVPDRLRAPRTT